MINKSIYDYDKVFLSFKDSKAETDYDAFSFEFESKSLKILSVGIIVGNLFLLLVESNGSYPIIELLIFRGGISLFLIFGLLNARLVKDQNSNQLQFLIFIINLAVAIGFFLANHFIELPNYALPNALHTLMFLTVLFSGLRFKNSVLYLLLIYAMYILYCTQIFPNPFCMSQINNMTINIIVMLVGAYLLEKYKRNIFITNHIIEHQRMDLESSNGLKDKLLSILSHDLRGPIGKLFTLLTLWKGKNITNDEFALFTQQISSEVERTSFLMDNLLHWSKSLLEGTHEERRETIVVYDIIQQNISIFQDQLETKKIRIQNLVDPSLRATLDVNIVHLCLRNLLSNAIKYTPLKGLVEVGFNRDRGFADFYVSDNGVGISKERKKQLFGLVLNSETGTNGEQGTGMGLFILKEFLEKVGGRMSFESKPGKGSTFIFRIPIYSGSQAD